MMHMRRRIACVIAAAVVVAMTGGALAQEGPIAYICIEAETGLVLSESNADLPRPPASMLKMMMMLLVVEGVERGDWTWDRQIVASAAAAAIGGSQVYLREGEVHDLAKSMQAVAVASANDMAYAVAENLWGSKEAYLKRMNERAQELGMADTVFYSVHGLPPDAGMPYDRTTARDMAILAQYCLRKDVIREWVGTRELQFRPQDAVKYNTNKLLFRMSECDGLKTGFTRAAGFCVAATAERDGIRLICVVMGHPSSEQRFRMAGDLLEEGFQQLQRYRYIAEGQEIDPPVRVYNAGVGEIRLVAAEDAWVALREQDKPLVRVVALQPGHISAPVAAGETVGEVQIRLGDRTIKSTPLVIAESIETPSRGWKLAHSARRRF